MTKLWPLLTLCFFLQSSSSQALTKYKCNGTMAGILKSAATRTGSGGYSTALRSEDKRFFVDADSQTFKNHVAQVLEAHERSQHSD